MSVTHTRSTVGAKRNGYDQRAYRKDGLRYSNLVTHKAAPTLLEVGLTECQTLVDYSPFEKNCPFRAVLALEVSKGVEGLIAHHGSEAKARRALRRLHSFALEATRKERTKRQRERKNPQPAPITTKPAPIRPRPQGIV